MLTTTRPALTLAEWERRGWLDNLKAGWPPEMPSATRNSLRELYREEAADPRTCRGCHESTAREWRPFTHTETGKLVVLFSCQNCQETWEV